MYIIYHGERISWQTQREQVTAGGSLKKKPGEKTLEDCYQQRIIPGGTMGERRDDIYFLVILIIWKYVHNQSTVHVSDNVDLN